MPRKKNTESTGYISEFTLEKLFQEVQIDLRIKEFVVKTLDTSSYSMKLNVPYRSEYFCMILVKKGYNKFRVDDKRYIISEGDVLFSPTSETFWIEEVSEDYVAKYIFFSIDFISNAGFNYRSSDVLRSLSEDPASVIRNEPDLFRRVEFHLDELKILNNPENDNYYFKELIWHHFSLVIYEIDNYFKKIEKGNPITYREDELTTSFFILVREHFKEEHTIQFYADKLCISRKYLTKVINKTMFKSPRDIVHQVLGVEARLLLKNSNANVNEVATQLGFSDQASFSKFFKKQAGISPLAYKRADLY
ncbi:AraC family transcriptional regulator [Chryseobacterium lactis]|uniref:AraC family transcriptional regulator n=1 Tax=Chryseobacterium lactis TaxID=1241981 RepID=A0A3G6RS68_CHRLC|nr:AraC family transcriptional regulator [Chryseobacterium lactis]AZA84496.1 AraC family transcriptional regulator [Chryseobacterium lactis]AZB04884.1 AraC family transcriptional regulator [Chryseobacterium lactis]PNW14615.1 AraC family transcriptional regulator [Chryseobacterium lactis]